MHKDGVVVAEYCTALPPEHELQQRLQGMLRDARERLARRELPSGELAGEFVDECGAQT